MLETLITIASTILSPCILWPVAIVIIMIYALIQLPDILGAFQYKHLAIQTLLEKDIEFFSNLIRNKIDKETLIIADNDIVDIYNTLMERYYLYNLDSLLQRYQALYPKGKGLKLEKINKKARTIEEKKMAVATYAINLKNVITYFLSLEDRQSRENLQFMLNNLIDITKGLI